MYDNIGTKLPGGDEKKIPPLVCIMKSGPAPVRRGGRGVDLSSLPGCWCGIHHTALSAH
jgi:hypothetical protein